MCAYICIYIYICIYGQRPASPAPRPPNGHGPPPLGLVGWMGGWVLGMFIRNIFGNASIAAIRLKLRMCVLSRTCNNNYGHLEFPESHVMSNIEC